MLSIYAVDEKLCIRTNDFVLYARSVVVVCQHRFRPKNDNGGGGDNDDDDIVCVCKLEKIFHVLIK